MSLDEKFIPIRTAFYKIVSRFFEKIAQFFGYPENPGMPTVYEMPDKISAKSPLFNNLPIHTTYGTPFQSPETWFEMIFGSAPKLNVVPRYIYENKEEGFYNFYIENYRNIFFLPNWASEFIQVRLNICLDISILETIREVLFVGLLIYSQIVLLRIAIAWFLYINPYTFPWYYLVAAVDWTEDALQGIVPSIFGVNVTATLFLGALGVLADSLNHLVFTMPFLPSEGEPTKLLINRQMKDVLVFHYLPLLWYKHPIPNDIREFWYYERPDILQYMQTAYKDLDIQLLPNSIIEQLNLKQQNDLVSDMHHYLEYLSTEALFQSNDFVTYINLINNNFHHFVLNYINSVL